ncbi:PD-(D/E)XK nuclease family protein [Thiocystis minor]|uniref:PDDEXK-like family protein n=1 Tax=Thiocystis minor TaxID=61597 RepID=UPI001911DAA6|nr:PD-(D/E)XK nuclease family protein [Thiocystis minor]
MSVTGLLGDVVVCLASVRDAKRRNADALLKQVFFNVATLRQARHRFADQLAPDFCLFDYLRTDEYGLSRCLVELLNPQGTHGQGRLFLDLFLARIGAANWAGMDRCHGVFPEKIIDKGRRIDIYLKFDSGVIGIENKPWAGDQNQQLSDYADWLIKDANGRHWLLVFLCNRDPALSSIDEDKKKEIKDHFVQVSYNEVIEWLGNGAEKTKALTVRIFVDELAKFIRANINEEIDMSEEQEIRNTILASDENLEAAFFIAHSFESTKKHLIQVLHNNLTKKIADKGYFFFWDDGLFSCKQREFFISFQRGQEFQLVFGFDGNGLNGFGWGISKNAERDKDATHNQQKWNAIGDIMANCFGGQPDAGTRPSDWVWGCAPDGIVFEKDYLNWASNPTPWQDMRNGRLAEIIMDVAEKTHTAFKDHMDLLMPDPPSTAC